MRTYTKGFFGLAALIILGVIVLGGAGYFATHPGAFKAPVKTGAEGGVQTAPGDHPEEDYSAMDGVAASGKIAINWKFEDAGEKDNIPYTKVSLNGQVVGTYEGSCKEIGALGGIDGKGLLTGEVAAAQCYYAGGGDEIGVFANEDGGYDVMVGELQEPSGEGEGFRGNFKIQTQVSL